MFSGTVPGGTLGTATLLILRMIGDFLNTSGAGQTFTIRVKYGGTTIHTFTSTAWASRAARRGDLSLVFLGAENATNAQRSHMSHWQAESADGISGGGGNQYDVGVNRGIAIDSTVNQTLEVTVQLGAANADLAWRRRGVWVEHDAPGAGGNTVILAQVIGGLQFNNTITETSIFSTTVPGGTIGTGNLLICRVISDMLNGTGAGQLPKPRVKYGGVTIYSGLTQVNVSSNAARYAYPIEFWLGGAGATNAQILGLFNASDSTAGKADGTVGTGSQQNNTTNPVAVDSSVSQTLEITIELSVANPQLDYRCLATTIYKLAA